MDNKSKIEALCIEMLADHVKAMESKIKEALDSGALDLNEWDENHSKMVIPKMIIAACLDSEKYQYMGRGTSSEKKVKKGVKNLRYFI